MLIAFFTLILSIISPAAACPTGTTNKDLIAPIQAAMIAAFKQVDMEAFSASASKAQTTFLCLQEPISHEAGAAYHRLQAVTLMVSGDEEGSRLAFAAAIRLDPTYRFTILPSGHAVLTAYGAARFIEIGEKVQVTDDLIDGSSQGVALSDLPYIGQQVDEESIAKTTYHKP